MDQKKYDALCEIVKNHGEEYIQLGPWFEALRLYCAKAIMEIPNRFKQLSKKEILGLFASVILSSFALTLANEVAVGPQRKIVDEIIKEINPQVLKEMEGIKH